MAATPYSAVLVPTSYFCAGVRNEYIPQALLSALFSSIPLHSVKASLTFTFAATIAVGGTISLNRPLESGRSGFSLKGRNYFKMNIA